MGGKNDLNDALLVLMIVPADNANEVERNYEKHHIVYEALNANALGVSAMFTTETTRKPFMEPTKAEFLAENSIEQLCRHLAASVETLRSDYFYNRNVFLICFAPIDGAALTVAPRLL